MGKGHRDTTPGSSTCSWGGLVRNSESEAFKGHWLVFSMISSAWECCAAQTGCLCSGALPEAHRVSRTPPLPPPHPPPRGFADSQPLYRALFPTKELHPQLLRTRRVLCLGSPISGFVTPHCLISPQSLHTATPAFHLLWEWEKVVPKESRGSWFHNHRSRLVLGWKAPVRPSHAMGRDTLH